MDVHYPTIDVPATAEYVLAVLQDEHRQLSEYSPVEGGVPSFETTVEAWRSACDLLEWRELGRALNQVWGITCSDDEWRRVLRPARQRRLVDVCQFIAARAARPVIRPSRLLVVACVPAGAFLTIRSLLHEAGAPTEEMTPSTPLAPYTRRFAQVFLGPISRLAPGALPPVRVRNPIYDVTLCGAFIGLVCLSIGGCSSMYSVAAAGMALYTVCYAGNWYAARCLFPASVEFGELRTFRDLALVVAEGSPTNSSQGSL